MKPVKYREGHHRITRRARPEAVGPFYSVPAEKANAGEEIRPEVAGGISGGVENPPLPPGDARGRAGARKPDSPAHCPRDFWSPGCMQYEPSPG